MDLLLVSLAALAAATGSLGAIELHAARRWHRTALTVELQFGRDLAPEAVVGVLEHLGAMRPGSLVVFDLFADHHGVRQLVTTDRMTLDRFRASLRALSPSTRLVPSQPPTGIWTATRRIVLGGRLRTLRDDTIAETSTALLAATQPLAAGERLLLRWTVRPSRPHQVPRVEQGVAVEPEDRRRLRAKNAGGVVRSTGVLAARAASRGASFHLLSRLTTVLRSRSTAYGRLTFRARLAWRPHELPPVSGWRQGDRYAALELAGLLGWAIGAPRLPGVALGTSPLLPASGRLPRRGRVLGTSTWPDDPRPVAQPIVGALSHSLIAGPTGVGKSTLLLNLLGGDLRDGRGFVLIDGKGDTARDALARIPKRRHADVVVLDCASDGPLPGLQLFAGHDSSLAADVVLGVLADLYKDSWGPLSERYLRAGLMAVAQDGSGTLADVPFVFSDAAYRRRLVGRLRDPLIRSTFAGFEAMSANEQQHQLAAPLGKLSQLLGRPVVRTILGQAAPKLDFAAVLRKQQIVVISLAPARVGAAAARLVGALSVFALFQAIQARSQLPTDERRPFTVYVDEPKALGDLPMPLDALFEQARGLGVGLTLAPQSMTQLPKSVREAALTNAATRIAFRQQADDARLLARDLAGVTPEDLQDLAAYEAVARVGLGPGDVVSPATIRTAAAPRRLNDPRELRSRSEQRFGMTLEAVDEQLQHRHEHGAQSAPIGRKRRTS